MGGLFERAVDSSVGVVDAVNAVPSGSGPQAVSQKLLTDLPFIDLLLRLDRIPHDPLETLYKPPGQAAGRRGLELVPESFDDEIRAMIRRLGSLEKTAGAFRHDGIFYRYQKKTSWDDGVWCNIRRFNAASIRLDDLGMAPEAVRSLKTWNRENGLILVAGAMANGKTTTMAHMLKHFLSTDGGVGMTIEDPPEYPLHGAHGDHGQCIQTEVHRGEWAASIQECMRMSASYIMLGEIRSPAAAIQALQAAATGHLVMATIHAGGVDDAVSRMSSLCASAFESGGDLHVRKDLARSLVGIAHQQLSSYGPDLALLRPETDSDRLVISQCIEQRQDGALVKGGWTKVFRAPRRSTRKEVI